MHVNLAAGIKVKSQTRRKTNVVLYIFRFLSFKDYPIVKKISQFCSLIKFVSSEDIRIINIDQGLNIKQ